MKEGLKIYKVEFESVYPVGSTLIIAAYDLNQAREMAADTIAHTKEFEVIEVEINEPTVIEYLSGDY